MALAPNALFRDTMTMLEPAQNRLSPSQIWPMENPVGTEQVRPQYLTAPDADVVPGVMWGDHMVSPRVAGGLNSAMDIGMGFAGSTGPSARPAAVPAEYLNLAKKQAKTEGMQSIDATGLHFLDGDKPVYAWNGADPSRVLGSRAAELQSYQRLTGDAGSVWYKPGEEARAREVLRIGSAIQKAGHNAPELADLDRAHGLALGYPPEAVEYYISRKYGRSSGSDTTP